MEAEFRLGRFEAGVIGAIENVSRHLARHFPASEAGRNELPDKPILI